MNEVITAKQVYLDKMVTMHARHESVVEKINTAHRQHSLVSLPVQNGTGYYVSSEVALSLWKTGLRDLHGYARDLGLDNASWQEDLRKLNTGEVTQIDAQDPSLCRECGQKMFYEKLYWVCRSQNHEPVINWIKEP